MSDEYIDISMLEPIWVCPNCGEDTIWDYNDASDGGTPWCRICDSDMEYRGAVLSEGYDIGDFHDSVMKSLLEQTLESLRVLKAEVKDMKSNAYFKVDWPESQDYLDLDGVSAMSDDGNSSVYVPWVLVPKENENK